MIRCWVLMVLLLLVPIVALGQEAEVGNGGEATVQPSEKEETTQDRPKSEPQQSFRPFKPTEKVDADASIPFPADI